MPGLASREDMKRLQAATGREADVLFATLLRAHHEGGLHLAEEAARRAGTPEVRRLADGMHDAQRDEIGMLDQIIARLQRSG
jgi:uncharacterized protein (DUF305 family)